MSRLDERANNRANADAWSPSPNASGDKESLIVAFIGNDPIAGEIALAGLALLGPGILDTVLERAGSPGQNKIRCRKLCAKLGPGAIPILINAVRTGSWGAKLAAAPCFSAFRGNQTAASELYKLLKLNDFDVQRLAIEALGNVGDDGCRWNLVRLALYDNLDSEYNEDSEPNRYSLGKLYSYVVEALTRFFAQTGERSHLDLIEDFIEKCVDRNFTFIHGAFETALEDMTPMAADALIVKWLNHDQPRYREIALQGLAHLRLKRTLPAIADVLLNAQEQADINRSAGIALGAFGGTHAARSLADALKSHAIGPGVHWAFSTLYAFPIEWGDPSDNVQSALASESEVHQQMLLSLGWRGNMSFRDELEKQLNDAEPFIRGTSSLALAHLQGAAAVDLLHYAPEEAANEWDRVFALCALVHAGQKGRGDALHGALRNFPLLPNLRPCWKREVISAMAYADADQTRAQLWAEIAGEPLARILAETDELRAANAANRPR